MAAEILSQGFPTNCHKKANLVSKHVQHFRGTLVQTVYFVPEIKTLVWCDFRFIQPTFARLSLIVTKRRIWYQNMFNIFEEPLSKQFILYQKLKLWFGALSLHSANPSVNIKLITIASTHMDNWSHCYACRPLSPVGLHAVVGKATLKLNSLQCLKLSSVHYALGLTSYTRFYSSWFKL